MNALNIQQGMSSHSAYDLRDPNSQVEESHTLSVLVENEPGVTLPGVSPEAAAKHADLPPARAADPRAAFVLGARPRRPRSLRLRAAPVAAPDPPRLARGFKRDQIPPHGVERDVEFFGDAGGNQRLAVQQAPAQHLQPHFRNVQAHLHDSA